MHVLRYEQLVSDPATTLAGVSEFLGLEQPIAADSIDGSRSDQYRTAWADLARSGSPLDRRRMARLRARFAGRIAAFGYDFDDLGKVAEFPTHPVAAEARTRPIRVLYVGGMPRSGSTLTDLMLHQLPGHIGVGELFYLWRNGLANDGLCACSESFSQCPFWSEVGRVAFGGWEETDAARVMKLQDQVDKTSSIPLLLSPWRPRKFAAQLDEYSSILRRVYSAIAEVSGEKVVVDSSKRPSLAYVLRTMPDVDLSVVHVVRDPRGVAFSFDKHVALPEGAALRNEMPRSTIRKVSRRWVTVNALISGLRRSGVPVTRVRYEDLVSHPQRELGKVLELTCHGAPQGVLDYVTDEGITVPRTHVVAGGRIRLASGRMPLRLDEQWRRDLPGRSRRLVEVMTVPTRRKYGYR